MCHRIEGGRIVRRVLVDAFFRLFIRLVYALFFVGVVCIVRVSVHSVPKLLACGLVISLDVGF